MMLQKTSQTCSGVRHVHARTCAPCLRVSYGAGTAHNVQPASVRHVAANSYASWRGETPEQAYQRRLRESEEVESRTIDIYTQKDLDRELASAGDKLLVLQIESEQLCQTGLDEEPELQWREDQQAAMKPCQGIKSTLQRTARECPDVRFLSLQVDDAESQAVADSLGVDVIPTVQFWRKGAKLWEHKGVLGMEQDLGEGVLYFGDTAAGGIHASDYVKELHSDAEMQQFLGNQPEEVLTVVGVCVSDASPCIRIFPAVVALARSFKGYATFGRLNGDESDETKRVMAANNIQEVPTFLFFKSGREVARHVGSSRGDLIGKILEVQSAAGVKPPPPPPRKTAPKAAKARR